MTKVVLNVGDKIRMSQAGVDTFIPTTSVPLGTIGTIVKIVKESEEDGGVWVKVKFETSPHHWGYGYDDAVTDLVQE